MRSKSVDMKIDCLRLAVEVRMAGMEIDETLSCAVSALYILGVRVPSKITLTHVIFKLSRVRRLLRSRTDEDFLALTPVQNRIRATAVRLLFDAGIYCATKDAENESAYYSLLAIELTVKYGLSPYCAPALVIYGTVEVAVGNHDRAYRAGNLALKVVEKLKCKEIECVTIGMTRSLISHWKEKNSDLVAPLDLAITVGFDTGDVIFAAFSAANSFGLRLILGMNLASTEQYMRLHYQRFCELEQNKMLLWLQPIVQFVLHLRSHPSNWEDLMTLSGEIMTESTYMQEVTEINHLVLVWLALSVKVQLAYHFGFYSEAAAIREKMDSTGKKAASNYNFPLWHFLGAMTHFELYRASNGNSKGDLKKIRKYKKGLQKIAFSPNVPPYLTLVEAEEKSIQTQVAPESVSEAVSAYERAIDSMAEAGWKHSSSGRSDPTMKSRDARK